MAKKRRGSKSASDQSGVSVPALLKALTSNNQPIKDVSDIEIHIISRVKNDVDIVIKEALQNLIVFKAFSDGCPPKLLEQIDNEPPKAMIMPCGAPNIPPNAQILIKIISPK